VIMIAWPKARLRACESQQGPEMIKLVRLSGVIIAALASFGLIACRPASPGAEGTRQVATPLCAPCDRICESPIVVPDSIFEPYHSFTISTQPKLLRDLETANLMDSGRVLQAAHEKYNEGNFGRTYKIYGAAITSLVNKKSADTPASEQEITAFKRVLTALYADAAVGLRQNSQNPPTPKYLAVYKENEESIEELISKSSGEFEMLPGQQVAVCRALSAYVGPARTQATNRTAEIVDQMQIYESINESNCLKWPSPEAKALGGKKSWGSFSPHNGDRGVVVAETFKCEADEEMYILKVGEYYVPIASKGVKLLEDDHGKK
jgi:hypothetical protein